MPKTSFTSIHRVNSMFGHPCFGHSLVVTPTSVQRSQNQWTNPFGSLNPKNGEASSMQSLDFLQSSRSQCINSFLKAHLDSLWLFQILNKRGSERAEVKEETGETSKTQTNTPTSNRPELSGSLAFKRHFILSVD